MRPSLRQTFAASLSVVAAVAFATGCQNDSTAAPSSSTESTQQAASEAQQSTEVTTPASPINERQRRRFEPPRGPGGHRGPPGPDFLLFAALHEIDLSDAQQTKIEGLIDSLHAVREGRPMPDPTVLKALASSIRAGKVDPSVVTLPAPDETKMTAMRAQLRAALQSLHDTLSADQRRTLVERIEAHAENTPPPPPERERGRGGADHDPGPMGWLRDLDLTTAQRKSIREAIDTGRPTEADRTAQSARFEAMRASMKANLAAFAADELDVRALMTPPEGLEPPKMGVHPMVADLAVIVPLLTESQRAQLADKIETPPSHEGCPGQ